MNARRRRSRGGPPPREVPGYLEAGRAGTLPVAPEQPPGLLAGPTALTLFHRFVALAVGGLVLIFALVVLVEELGASESLRSMVFLGTGLGYLVSLLFTLPIVGRRSVTELQHGYTTLVLEFGGFWFGEGPLTRSGDMRAAWDYRGTWHLHHRDGRTLRAPDRGIDPPGLYPSPNSPGRRELWTGATWLGHFAD
ncbi:hypothetical protein BLA60_16985 [Actinophytocola xinjiangensis]|uniref:Uncharacterized protein n=1 Tax=Actinophytocola xinjiangensis TaxID=485602 RepID=A0A7Z0WLD5_9PSEU|nr:hypothetical protein [Actinophytocola xinjiangensis]OLF10142.1 hypothetical protein BLA60_16985 [Actinophytocola xinjiangensis]